MRLLSIIKKSILEYMRSLWLLLLMVSMAPFFVFVYYLFIESENQDYELLFINNDRGIMLSAGTINHGNNLIKALKSSIRDSLHMPITIEEKQNRQVALELLRSKRADALIVLPEDFSKDLSNLDTEEFTGSASVEFVGDLTDVQYMFCAVMANEFIQDHIYNITGRVRPLIAAETPLGSSGEISGMDVYMPGIFILSIIMIMFTAMFAFVSEVENRTMIRLRLSKITVFEYLCGISIVQVLIGVISVILTLMTAMALGFDFRGGLILFLVIAILTSISIIAFSLITAAFMKTVNEVLIIGNFPLFLFMFFTGAMFPIQGLEMFSIGGYPITIQGLMSPVHSINALRKIMIMDMRFAEIIPEIITLIIITFIYFIAGILLFHRRHMRVK